MPLGHKDALSLLLTKSDERRAATNTKSRNNRKHRDGTHHYGAGVQNKMEEFLVEAIDRKDVSEKFVQTLQDIMDGKKRVGNAFDEAVIPALLEMMIQLKNSPSEKQRMEAAKEFLDRAGHGKVTKVQNTHEHLTPQSDPMELIAGIMGIVRDTRIEQAIDTEAEDIE